LIIWSFKNL